MALNYFTVQDMLWLNLEVTDKRLPWDSLRLEEATFYQYGHGSSEDLIGQAARFLTGFVKQRPFPEGNDACAFIGCLMLLEMNGKTLELSDGEAAAWARGVWLDPASARAAIEEKSQDGRLLMQHGVPDAQAIGLSLLSEYAGTVRSLNETEAPVPIEL